MNQQELSDRLWDFAARVGEAVEALPDTRLGRHVAGQLIRCGTSPAPNYDESGAAESRKDFVHKMSVALKELRETRGWLRFSSKAGLLSDDKISALADESEQLCRILGKSVLTLKGGASRPTNDRLKISDDRFQDSPSCVIDLTRTLEHGQKGVSLATKFTRERDGWNARTLELYSHTGTHLDAPAHFLDGGRTVEEMPLSDCMGAAHVIELTRLEPKALIDVEHLGAVAESFQRGESLLLHTGWSMHFKDPEYYRRNFPRVSEGLARWCADNGVKMLGVEPLSVADVRDLPEVTLIHEILLAAGIVIVEGLVNLHQITRAKTFFAALPLKIGGGDGTPCRAFAVEGDLNELA